MLQAPPKPKRLFLIRAMGIFNLGHRHGASPFQKSGFLSYLDLSAARNISSQEQIRMLCWLL